MLYFSRLRREPLVHFALIGLAIFAINAWLQPTAPAASDTIVIAQPRIDHWREQFRRGNGRWPTATEQHATVTQWVDEEVLYRQALQLGLHQNDSIVRRQLIQKMDFVLEGATPLPAATDEQLQAFMQSQPSAYGQSETFSFQQIFISRSPQGNPQHTAQQLLAGLQTDPANFSGQGDSFPLGQHIRNANAQLLHKHFGQQFLHALQALPTSPGWQGPIQSGLGWHLIRITQRTAAQAPTLIQVREKVALDYRLQQQQTARRNALDALHQQYTIAIGNTNNATAQ